MNGFQIRPGQRVLVAGQGVTGVASACVLAKRGWQVCVAGGERIEPATQEKLRKAGAAVAAPPDLDEAAREADWILVSPGIAPHSELYSRLEQSKRPVLSEIEAASQLCRSRNVIAVTGTAGKTTLVTLIAAMFTKAGRKPVVCGNIGTPWIQCLENIGPDTPVIVEVSSFQLYHCRSFAPRIAVLVNISPNHEDWHGSPQAYLDAKLNLFRHQTRKDFILCREAEAELIRGVACPGAEMRICTSPEPAGERRAFLEAIAGIDGLDSRLPGQVLDEFAGLEHRLEPVTSISGIRWVNDSKSTTPASLVWALKAVEGPLILIAGGRAKSGGFREAGPCLRSRVRKAFLIGEAAGKLQKAWEDFCPVQICSGGLEQAVTRAAEMSGPGDTVLFSPACSSFDMFRDYMERGRMFKKTVLALPALNRQTERVQE